MKNKTLKALRAFQENVSASDYEFDKGEEYISSQDWDDDILIVISKAIEFKEEVLKEIEKRFKKFYEFTPEQMKHFEIQKTVCLAEINLLAQLLRQLEE